MEGSKESKLALSPVKYSSPVPLTNEEKMSQDLTDKLVCRESSSTYGEEEPAIRSVAIIKKSQVEFPVSFRELQSNTDLKTPPSNWLRGQFSICFPNLTPKQSDFTSFIMGYQFPDCIGDVDIVSDAENIKKLLKMAYNPNTHLSMMVHRIGKTILIDEFDVYKYLLRRSQCEWKWLKKFFYEHVLESLARKNVLVKPNKSRDVVQSKNLLSKFLYHSLGEEKIEPEQPDADQEQSPVTVRTLSSPSKDGSMELLAEDPLPDPSVQAFTRNIIWNFEDLQMLIGTDLPIFGGRTHPCVSLRLRDMDKPISILTGIDYWLDNLMCNVPEVVMCYHQNGIVQKYELIKTEDLPHMSGSQFSPQLVRDIAHNILSFLKSKATKEGHTYWLFKGKDDDIVKLYDLTSLGGDASSFSPFESTATDDGNEKTSGDEDDDNPFTVPVAMLLYCVAKNMWGTKDSVPKAPTIRALLESTLNLLRKDKYPKVFCHAHLILADIYLPQDIDPDNPRLPDVPETSVVKENTKGDLSPETRKGESKKKGKGKKGTEFNSIRLSTLCGEHTSKGNKHKSSGPPMLSRNVYDRCNAAIRHVISALTFLESFPPEATFKSKSSSPGVSQGLNPEGSEASEVFDEPKMAKQFVPIPMSYEPLNKKSPPSDTPSKDGTETPPAACVPNVKPLKKKGRSEGEADSSGKERSVAPLAGRDAKNGNVIVPKVLLAGAVLSSHLKDASWVDKVRFQLLRKAALTYMTKGRIELDACNYGYCLRYVKLAIRAWCAMLSILGSETEFPLPAQPLLLAGDAYYNLSKLWELAPSHTEDFNRLTKEQKDMTEILDKIAPGSDSSWLIKIPCDNVESMTLSYKSFKTAIDSSAARPDHELLRRMASICNELGCMYMNQADQLCQKLGGGVKSGGALWEDSEEFLEKAFEIFRDVDDRDNLALLHCNKGRYLRLYAFHSSSGGKELSYSPVIKSIYEKAFFEYEQALAIMSNKQNTNSPVTDSVVWEYSTTLFGFATIIQDMALTDKDCLAEDPDLSKYVASLFNKCLTLCERKTSSTREPLYKYRAGVIHIRLASMYHDKYRREKNSRMLYLAEYHYLKSCAIFIKLDTSATDIFKVHLDYMVLLEDSLEAMKSPLSQFKAYLSIIKLLEGCMNGLSLIQKASCEKNEEKSKGTKKRLKGKKEKKKEGKEKEAEEGTGNNEEAELANSLMELLQTKLQKTLFSLMKLVRGNQKSINVYGQQVKEMYTRSLNQSNLPLETHLASALSFIISSADTILNSLHASG